MRIAIAVLICFIGFVVRGAVPTLGGNNTFTGDSNYFKAIYGSGANLSGLPGGGDVTTAILTTATNQVFQAGTNVAGTYKLNATNALWSAVMSLSNTVFNAGTNVSGTYKLDATNGIDYSWLTNKLGFSSSNGITGGDVTAAELAAATNWDQLRPAGVPNTNDWTGGGAGKYLKYGNPYTWDTPTGSGDVVAAANNELTGSNTVSHLFLSGSVYGSGTNTLFQGTTNAAWTAAMALSNSVFNASSNLAGTYKLDATNALWTAAISMSNSVFNAGTNVAGTYKLNATNALWSAVMSLSNTVFNAGTNVAGNYKLDATNGLYQAMTNSLSVETLDVGSLTITNGMTNILADGSYFTNSAQGWGFNGTPLSGYTLAIAGGLYAGNTTVAGSINQMGGAANFFEFDGMTELHSPDSNIWYVANHGDTLLHMASSNGVLYSRSTIRGKEGGLELANGTMATPLIVFTTTGGDSFFNTGGPVGFGTNSVDDDVAIHVAANARINGTLSVEGFDIKAMTNGLYQALTNQVGGTLPVPTNAPAAGLGIVATSASSAAWMNGWPTNANTTTPDFAVPYSLLSTNAAFKFLAPANVDTTKTRFEAIVVFVTNSTAAAVAITAPDNCHLTGTAYVTNVSACTFSQYAQKFTNLTVFPIW